jgi:hypothetical protein
MLWEIGVQISYFLEEELVRFPEIKTLPSAPWELLPL